MHLYRCTVTLCYEAGNIYIYHLSPGMRMPLFKVSCEFNALRVLVIVSVNVSLPLGKVGCQCT